MNSTSTITKIITNDSTNTTTRLSTNTQSTTTSDLYKRYESMHEAYGLEVGGGKYMLIKKLGQGTCGQAWVAEKLSSKKQYVIKTFTNENSTDPTAYGMSLKVKGTFPNEANILVKIGRTAIYEQQEGKISFTKSSKDGVQPTTSHTTNTVFLVTDLIPGETLARKLDNATKGEQPISIEDAVKWMISAIDSLDELHKRNIFHGDCGELGNLMVDGNGVVRLIDFGDSHDVEAEELPKKNINGFAYTTKEMWKNDGISNDINRLYSVFSRILSNNKCYMLLHAEYGMRANLATLVTYFNLLSSFANFLTELASTYDNVTKIEKTVPLSEAKEKLLGLQKDLPRLQQATQNNISQKLETPSALVSLLEELFASDAKKLAEFIPAALWFCEKFPALVNDNSFRDANAIIAFKKLHDIIPTFATEENFAEFVDIETRSTKGATVELTQGLEKLYTLCKKNRYRSPIDMQAVFEQLCTLGARANTVVGELQSRHTDASGKVDMQHVFTMLANVISCYDAIRCAPESLELMKLNRPLRLSTIVNMDTHTIENLAEKIFSLPVPAGTVSSSLKDRYTDARNIQGDTNQKITELKTLLQSVKEINVRNNFVQSMEKNLVRGYIQQSLQQLGCKPETRSFPDNTESNQLKTCASLSPFWKPASSIDSLTPTAPAAQATTLK